MLKALAVVAVGGGIALLGSGLFLNSKSTTVSSAQTRTPTLASETGGVTGGDGAYTKVKVRYFQMSSTLPGLSQEYFALPSPTNFGELLQAVISSHPVLSSMMPSMLILVDGVVPKSDTVLNDGDEVDFIPAIGGG